METVCQVNFNVLSGADREKSERIVREYLLRVCDSVKLTIVGTSPYSLFSLWPFSRTKKLKKILQKEDFINEEDTGETEKAWNLKLTENVKKIINEATLFWNSNVLNGFTDPKFSRKGNEVANLISNERILNLYIPDTDKGQLANLGVQFDDDYSEV